MTYTVRFEDNADRELNEAFKWYEAHRYGLGGEFLSSVAVLEEILSRAPRRFAETTPPYRWAKLRRFPYGLHYMIIGDVVSVLACVHFRQDPVAWPGA